MYCVIVGDIVKSRQLEPLVREKATRVINETFDRINTEYIKSLMAPFGMVRGDAFEGVILTQHYAPKIAQDIIKALYRVDKTMVHISVALGQLSVTGSDRNITDGPAFHTALDNLEKMKKNGSQHWLQISFTIGPLAQALFDSQIALLSALTESWTDKQREIVWATEMYGGYKKLVSKNLGVQASVVSKQLKAARYDTYRQAWDGMTDFLVNMDNYSGEEAVVEKSYVPYFNLAKREYKLHNNELAVSLLQKSLELAKKDFGQDTPLLIPIYIGLTETYVLIGKNDDAENAIQEAERLQAELPKTRLEYIETLMAKASVCNSKGDFTIFEKCYLNALEIAKTFLNANHPIFRTINNDLAVRYMLQGKYQKALNLFTDALNNINISRRKNEYPIDYAVILGNMANCNKQLGNYKQALAYGEESLNVFLENLPPNHEDVIKAKELLAGIKSMAEVEKA